jgi:hypothetical protein
MGPKPELLILNIRPIDYYINSSRIIRVKLNFTITAFLGEE